MPGYILWFPFRLPPEQNFSGDLSDVVQRRLPNFSVALGEKSGVYYLQVAAFPDEASAEAFIPKLHAALMWAALKQNLSPQFVLEPQEVVHAEDRVQAGLNLAKSFGIDPEKLGPVDCLIDTGRPAILPEAKVVRYLTAGNATLVQSYVPGQTVDFVCEGASFARPEQVVADAKLLVALELYNGFIRESSTNGRFLTLVMALEALAPDELKPPVVQQLIEDCMRVLDERQAKVAQHSDEWFAYDALRRELGFRRETSIRQKIRTLVRTTLSQHGDPDADEIARATAAIYDQRSKLVHDGFLPKLELSQATEKLRNIVRRVLEARFIAVAR